MSLDLDIRLQQGQFTLDCQLSTRERVIGLFGPSGAGKSSLLRAVAGLARPDSGHIEIDGQRVYDAARNWHVPAHRRRIGVVFQQSRLLPHFNVEHNLCLGRWFRRERLDRAEFAQLVDMLDIGHLLKRRTRALSGGECQRVAIGRALLSQPRLLLLDEPLASLDAQRKQEVLPYIERISRESDLPILFVSHQLDELLRLANRHVAAIQQGRIVFSGPTAEFLSHPEYLGHEAGQDAGALLATRLVGHDDEHQLSILACAKQRLFVPSLPRLALGSEVRVHVRARDVMLARQPMQDMSALNQLQAQIVALEESATDRQVTITLDVAGQRLSACITQRSARALNLQTGQSVVAVIKSLALAEQAWQRLGGL